LRLECPFYLKALADAVQGVGRYPIGSVTHRQTLERPIFLLKGNRLESVGISLGKRAGIGNNKNGTLFVVILFFKNRSGSNPKC